VGEPVEHCGGHLGDAGLQRADDLLDGAPLLEIGAPDKPVEEREQFLVDLIALVEEFADASGVYFYVALLVFRGRAVDCNERWKGRRLAAVPELQAPLHEAEFSLAVYPVMEPARIGSRMGQQHNSGTRKRGEIALPRPLSHLHAIGWVAENNVFAPILP
jgi:hypothetical protein